MKLIWFRVLFSQECSPKASFWAKIILRIKYESSQLVNKFFFCLFHVGISTHFWNKTSIKSFHFPYTTPDSFMNQWSVCLQAKTEPVLVLGSSDWTLPCLYNMFLCSLLIASMSLSCGAGHVDDVSMRCRGEFLDKDNRDQLGGVIYWLWGAHSLSWVACSLMTRLLRLLCVRCMSKAFLCS